VARRRQICHNTSSIGSRGGSLGCSSAATVQCPRCGDSLEGVGVGAAHAAKCYNTDCEALGSFCTVHLLPLELLAAGESIITSADVEAAPGIAKERSHFHGGRYRVCPQCVGDMRDAAVASAAAAAATTTAPPTCLLKALGTKPCPSCGTGVQKAPGCRHMTCMCGHEFFWCCGRAYRDSTAHRAHVRDSTCDDYATHSYHPGTVRHDL
jgi:hypothetical protein